jgi:hypothetical protein
VVAMPKILESKRPYHSYRVYGPYKHSQDTKRLIVILVKSDKRISITFARFIYETHYGKRFPKHYDVDHIDGDQSNDDISNLQLLTRSENAAKGPTIEARKRVNVATSKRLKLHPIDNLGSKNGNSKLSEKEVLKIKKALTPHYRGLYQKLSKEFNVTPRIIRAIKNGEKWKHVA